MIPRTPICVPHALDVNGRIGVYVSRSLNGFLLRITDVACSLSLNQASGWRNRLLPSFEHEIISRRNRSAIVRRVLLRQRYTSVFQVTKQCGYITVSDNSNYYK
jgi:hypothetical protein